MAKLPPHVKAGRVIRLLGWLSIIAGVALSISMIMLLFARPDFEAIQLIAPLLLGAFYAAIGWLQLILGRALKQHKPWSRIVGIIYAALALLGVPIGTILGGFLLYWLIAKWDDVTVEPGGGGYGSPAAGSPSPHR